MHVEVLYWDGCPSYPRALADLRDAMVELDLEPSGIHIREITNEAEARRERFVGSPTIRIDGVDVVPSTSEAYGLTCRVYHRRDGRISPTPDPSDVRTALRAAVEHA
jgi:predicted Zn-dependent protease